MSDDDLDALLRASFPFNRGSWFAGRRTWFLGVVESVITVAGLDGYADWEGDLLYVVERAIVPCGGNVKPGDRLRFEATVVETTPGMYGLREPVLLGG
jgi:hypothetical protein